MCTWTKASLQFPPANSVCGLLLSGPRPSLSRRSRRWRNHTSLSRQSGKVVPRKSNPAKLISPMGIRPSSIMAAKRMLPGDFSWRYAQWESPELNSPRAVKASFRKGKAMKARALRYLPLCVFFLTACDSAASRNPVESITFDSAKRLDDFGFTTSGNGNPGEWLIVDNDAGRALAPIDTQAAENRLSFAIYRFLLGTRRLRVDSLHDRFRQDRSGRRRIRPV